MIIWTFVDFWNRYSLTTDVSHRWYQCFCQGAGPGAGFHSLQLSLVIPCGVYEAGDMCYCIKFGCATSLNSYFKMTSYKYTNCCRCNFSKSDKDQSRLKHNAFGSITYQLWSQTSMLARHIRHEAPSKRLFSDITVLQCCVKRLQYIH